MTYFCNDVISLNSFFPGICFIFGDKFADWLKDTYRETIKTIKYTGNVFKTYM